MRFQSLTMISLFLGNHTYQENQCNSSELILSRGRASYELGERISCGGNAVVHRCINSKDGNVFAAKILLKASAKAKERFQREVQLLRKVSHPHLMKYVDDGSINVKVVNTGKTIKVPFVIMPLASANLFDYFKKNSRTVPFESYIAQFKGLAQALGVLHTYALHRDIKPENVLVIGETWLLSDFGLCQPLTGHKLKLTHENEIVGPRLWMSPEATNKAVGCRDKISKMSDVYQLASLFWFIATGRHPSGVLDKSDWTGPDSIYEVLFRSLSHSEKNRPQDGNELFNKIQIALTG